LKKVISITLSLALITVCAFAHGDLHERITAIGNLIDKQPNQTSLYLDRAILYTQHNQYELALIDIDYCKSKNHTPNKIFYYEAQSYLAISNYEKALTAVSNFLKLDSLNVNAERLKGTIYYEYQCYQLAAKSYDKVIQNAEEKFPSNYIESAYAWKNANTPKAKSKAVEVLIKGTNEIGEIPVLLSKIVDFAQEFEAFSTAHTYQNKLIKLLSRKEVALLRRAKIFIAEEKTSAAYKDLIRAKELIQNLPRGIKKTPAIVNISKEISQIINNL